jgi:hypothetical protein
MQITEYWNPSTGGIFLARFVSIQMVPIFYISSKGIGGPDVVPFDW